MSHNVLSIFFFNDTATTEIYTLSLHDALPILGAGFGTPGAVGEALLRKFLVPFEGASILLLVAAVGAAVLARKRRGLPEGIGPRIGMPPQVSRDDVAESSLLGGADVDPSRLPAGTAAGKDDVVA